MANDHNIKIYTSADIEKYLKGLLSAREMHAMEKAALDDAFLAEALEGYAAHHLNTSADIADLKNRLAKRTQEEEKIIPISRENKPTFSWWKVAAMIVLIAGASLIVYQLGFNRKSVDIAQTTQKDKARVEPKATDTTISTDLSATATSKESATPEKQQTNEIKTEDEKSRTSPLTRKQTAEKYKKSLLNKNNNESLVNAPVSIEAVPGLATEKRDDTVNDDALRQKAGIVKQEELIAKNRDKEAEIVVNAIQQKRAVAAQNQGFYKDQRKLASNRANVFRGRVTDAQNNALPFSNISNTRDSIGTYADANGYFNLTSPDSVLNVQVSSIGFETSNVQLQNTTPSNRILLREDRNSLSEIVISNKKPNSTRSRNNTMVLEEPEPADGWVNYDLYLANNLKEPEDLKEKPAGSRGEVELSFEVNKSGEPVNITVNKSLCEACDREAVRLVKEGPKWKRKAKKGKASVRISF